MDGVVDCLAYFGYFGNLWAPMTVDGRLVNREQAILYQVIESIVQCWLLVIFAVTKYFVQYFYGSFWMAILVVFFACREVWTWWNNIGWTHRVGCGWHEVHIDVMHNFR